MLQQIDHIVVIVDDLEQAMADAQVAGFTVVPGGEHAGGETHNALIAFGDGTYVELLAFRGPQPDPAHYFAERYRRGRGLAEFSLLSDDLEGDVAALDERGLAFPKPVVLGRERPDGTEVKWRMSLPKSTHPGAGFPFLIEDTSPRGRRVPSTAADTTHANGAAGVAGVSVVVPDLALAAEAYRTLLDAPPDSRSRVGSAGRGLIRLDLPGRSRQWVALVQAMPGSVPAAYLEQFGVGPYAVNLRRRPDDDVYPGEGTLIDPQILAGARFYV